MHRWLVAIFALHFFLNVSAFSWAHAPSQAMQSATWTEAAEPASVSLEGHSAPGGLPSQSSGNHGLMDELPDLPDTMTRQGLVLKQPVEPGCTVARVALRKALRSPDTPLRPPQETVL